MPVAGPWGTGLLPPMRPEFYPDRGTVYFRHTHKSTSPLWQPTSSTIAPDRASSAQVAARLFDDVLHRRVEKAILGQSVHVGQFNDPPRPVVCEDELIENVSPQDDIVGLAAAIH